MTGEEFQAHVEADKPVFLRLNYGGWSWEVAWDDRDHMLKLAELLIRKPHSLPPEYGQDSLLDVEENDLGHLCINVSLD